LGLWLSESGIPEIHAVYRPIITAQINGACLAAGEDSLPNIKLLAAAIGVINDDSLKFNGRALNSDLKPYVLRRKHTLPPFKA
jgi:hypothetical protein